MQCNLSSIYWLILYGRECVESTDMKTNKMKPCQPGVYSSHTHLAPRPPIATISPFFSLLFSNIHHYYPPSPFLFPPSSKGCCKWYWTKYGKQAGAGPYLFLTQATTCHKAWTSGLPVEANIFTSNCCHECQKCGHQARIPAQKSFCTANPLSFCACPRLGRVLLSVWYLQLCGEQTDVHTFLFDSFICLCNSATTDI